MANKHGSLSIDSDNLFPIIKKWLYSDHDIFYRELISNGCDAITKLKKLDMMGEYSLPADYKAKIPRQKRPYASIGHAPHARIKTVPARIVITRIRSTSVIPLVLFSFSIILPPLLKFRP